MARADLSAMLGKLDDSTPPPAAETPTVAPKPPSAKRANARPAREATVEGYRSFERKETRLRPDQYANLTEEARRLNRARSGGTRITENTLIRVAIDLLLERSGQLAGETEEELRKSVTL